MPHAARGPSFAPLPAFIGQLQSIAKSEATVENVSQHVMELHGGWARQCREIKFHLAVDGVDDDG